MSSTESLVLLVEGDGIVTNGMEWLAGSYFFRAEEYRRSLRKPFLWLLFSFYSDASEVGRIP